MNKQMTIECPKYILDMTCGGRSMWWNKENPYAVYFDQRDEEFTKVFGTDKSERHIRVHPDVIGDFRHLPFPDESFHLVVFDPPHIIQKYSENAWVMKQYGHYET